MGKRLWSLSGRLFGIGPVLLLLPLAQVPAGSPLAPGRTGEIVPVQTEPLPRVGAGIAPPSTGTAREERPVARTDEATFGAAEAEDETLRSLPPELRAATRAQLPRLRACRTEIAAGRRASAASVPLGALLLRFTIQPSGAVTEPEVVALEPTDPSVLTCVRDRLLSLRYDAPPPSDTRIEYRLAKR